MPNLLHLALASTAEQAHISTCIQPCFVSAVHSQDAQVPSSSIPVLCCEACLCLERKNHIADDLLAHGQRPCHQLDSQDIQAAARQKALPDHRLHWYERSVTCPTDVRWVGADAPEAESSDSEVQELPSTSHQAYLGPSAGCTAVVALVRGNALLVANAGRILPFFGCIAY